MARETGNEDAMKLGASISGEMAQAGADSARNGTLSPSIGADSEKLDELLRVLDAMSTARQRARAGQRRKR